MKSEDKEEVWGIVELMGHVRLAGRLSEEERFGTKMGRLDIPTDYVCSKCGGTGNGEFSTGPDPADSPCAACLGNGKTPGFVTQFFAGGSVYRITIVTEAVARHVSKGVTPAPISPWDFPKQLSGPEPARAELDDEELEDFGVRSNRDDDF